MSVLFQSMARILPPFLILLMIVSAGVCHAENTDLSPGLTAWHDGRLEVARDFFEGVRSKTPPSRELETNLGFLALEMKDYAVSLYHLRYAHLLGERSPQLVLALRSLREKHSRALVTTRHETTGPLSFFSNFTSAEREWFSWISFLIILALLPVVLARGNRLKQWAKALLFFCLLTLLPFALLCLGLYPAWPEALVLTFPWSEVPAKVSISREVSPVFYSPDENSQVVFMLQAGDEVEVLDRDEGWSKIFLPGNRKGWIKNSLLFVLEEAAS